MQVSINLRPGGYRPLLQTRRQAWNGWSFFLNRMLFECFGDRAFLGVAKNEDQRKNRHTPKSYL